MINEDEDLLVCDFAETYGVFNYRELSPDTVAALLVGLRNDSRIRMKASGYKITLKEQLLALILDDIRFIKWTKTDHGRRRTYDGKSIFEMLMHPKEKEDYMVFDNAEDFDAFMKSFEV